LEKLSLARHVQRLVSAVSHRAPNHTWDRGNTPKPGPRPRRIPGNGTPGIVESRRLPPLPPPAPLELCAWEAGARIASAGVSGFLRSSYPEYNPKTRQGKSFYIVC
jgi:hypothetical protein